MANWVLADPRAFAGVFGFRATILLQMAMWPQTSTWVPLQVSLCLPSVRHWILPACVSKGHPKLHLCVSGNSGVWGVCRCVYWVPDVVFVSWCPPGMSVCN